MGNSVPTLECVNRNGEQVLILENPEIKYYLLNNACTVEHMGEDNNVQKFKRWKPMSKRPIGRPKDEVLEDINSINTSNWKKVAQNRHSSKKVVEQATTVYRL